MKKTISVIIAIIMIITVFTACGKDKTDVPAPIGKTQTLSGDSELLGVWYESEKSGVLVFNADGSGSICACELLDSGSSAVYFKYTAMNGGVLFTISDDANSKMAAEGSYEFADGGLYITIDETRCFFIRTSNDKSASIPDAITADLPIGSEAPSTPSISGEDNSSVPSQPSANSGEPDDTTEIPKTDDEIKISIVGTWTANYNGGVLTYTFSGDGTGFASMSGFPIPITYSVSDCRINVTGTAFGQTASGSAYFEFIGSNLLKCTKDDGSQLTFSRVN